MWVWKQALEISYKRFVGQNVYVVARYNVVIRNGRRINFDDTQNASTVLSECGGCSGRSVDLTAVRVQSV